MLDDAAVMKLSEYLATKHVSPSDFAAQLGVSGEAVRLYTLGKRTPRRSIMQKIKSMTAGSVTADDFTGDAASDQEADADQERCA